MGTSLVKDPIIDPAAERALAWVRLLAPRTPEEAAMARRIAGASRHIWAFRLQLTIAERMAWYRAWGSR
jgi:hypothetical protein